ncbi:MAG: methylation [Ramlibacter sp.]|nr:methylation [Ramlibacter sp.]
MNTPSTSQAAFRRTRRPFARSLVRGFTLLESVVVMAVMATLASVAVPSMTWFIDSVKISSATDLMLSGLSLARSEAIKRNARVVLCKSEDGESCTTTGGWEQGWIVFHDANRNGVLDGGETIILREQPLAANLRLSGNMHVANYISYAPTGVARLAGGGFQAGTLTLCRRSAETGEGRQIVINSGGRPRVQRATVEMCV